MDYASLKLTVHLFPSVSYCSLITHVRIVCNHFATLIYNKCEICIDSAIKLLDLFNVMERNNDNQSFSRRTKLLIGTYKCTLNFFLHFQCIFNLYYFFMKLNIILLQLDSSIGRAFRPCDLLEIQGA